METIDHEISDDAAFHDFGIPTDGDAHAPQPTHGLPDSARADYQVAIGGAASVEELNALKASIRSSCEVLGDSHVYKFLLEKMAERAATLKGE